MRVNLLFGFLGAGKTTLVKHLLAAHGRDCKTAVIVNEFGEVGVDGRILQGDNVDIIELTSGCLCCTLKGSLILALEELHERSGVERVIVEATGVAQPGEMLETLADPSSTVQFEIGPLVTVVDSAKFSKLRPMLGAFYASQIENADILVLNKIDLVAPDQMEKIGVEARQLNPRADILFADQGEVDGAYLLDRRHSGMIERMQAAKTDRDAAAASVHHEHAHAHHHAAPAESFVLVPGGKPLRAEVEHFFQGLPDSVWRAKGYMRIDDQTCLVQFALGQLEISPAAAASAGGEKCVFIGRGMDRPCIEAQFAQVGRSQ